MKGANWKKLATILIPVYTAIAVLLIITSCADNELDALHEWSENSQIEGGIYTYPVTFFLLDMRYARFEEWKQIGDWWGNLPFIDEDFIREYPPM